MSMIELIRNKCHENLQLGCDTVDLVIQRLDKQDATTLVSGGKGPTGNVLVPFIHGGVQRGWVVNFQITELLDYLDGKV